jgi:phosphoserine phosphatase
LARLRVTRRTSQRDADVRAVLAGAASAAAAEVEDVLPVPPDPTAAAFFDVDNTMIRGASIYFFGKGMAGAASSRPGPAPLRLAAAGLPRARQRGPDAVAEARDKALGLVAGKSVDEIVAYGEEIYDELMERRIWSGHPALAQQHLDAGSASGSSPPPPSSWRASSPRGSGLTGALGTVSEVEDGLYTGRLVGEPLHGPAKGEAVPGARRARGARPQPLHRLQRQHQRHPDAVRRRPRGRDQPRLGAARAGPRQRLGRPRLPHRRKAAKVGVPAAAGAGALAGGSSPVSRCTAAAPTRPAAWQRPSGACADAARGLVARRRCCGAA